jgi:hypothetical protein
MHVSAILEYIKYKCLLSQMLQQLLQHCTDSRRKKWQQRSHSKGFKDLADIRESYHFNSALGKNKEMADFQPLEKCFQE